MCYTYTQIKAFLESNDNWLIEENLKNLPLVFFSSYINCLKKKRSSQYNNDFIQIAPSDIFFVRGNFVILIDLKKRRWSYLVRNRHLLLSNAAFALQTKKEKREVLNCLSLIISVKKIRNKSEQFIKKLQPKKSNCSIL